MKHIYIAGPYRASTPEEIEQNIQRAEAMRPMVVSLGHVPVCPHSMTRGLDGAATEEFWVKATLSIMERCDAVLLVPTDWSQSEGTRGEVDRAHELGMPVFTHPDALAHWLADQQEASA